MDIIDIKNRRRCIIALITCILLILTTFIGVVIKILAPITETNPIAGIQIFRYFTVISNILINACAIMCIPYEIDGIRNTNYHLPRWIVDLTYASTTCTTITFIIAAAFIAPIQGFRLTFLWGSLPFLHLICPLLSLILFLFINYDHTIKTNRIGFAMSFSLLYSLIYILMVYVRTEDNGGWFDHYYLKGTVPLWLLIIAMLITSFLVSLILRKIHNKQHHKNIAFQKECYLQICEKHSYDIYKTIDELADNKSKKYTEGYIQIPTIVIEVLKQGCNCNIENDMLYKAYIEMFLTKLKNNQYKSL